MVQIKEIHKKKNNVMIGLFEILRIIRLATEVIVHNK
jgi:hypothetical protein